MNKDKREAIAGFTEFLMAIFVIFAMIVGGWMALYSVAMA